MNIVEQLEDLVEREPFAPFTILVAGGRQHRIEHPEFLGFSPRKKTVLIWTQHDTAILVNSMLISEVETESGEKR